MRVRISAVVPVACLLAAMAFGLVPAPTLAALSAQDDGPIDESSYESPAFGYTVEWDESTWAEASAVSEDGGDQLLLRRDLGSLYIDSYAGSNLDVTGCIEAEIDVATAEDGVTDFAVAENADGDPIEQVTDDQAYGVYTFILEDDTETSERAVFVECRSIEDGDAILQITAINFDRGGYDSFIGDALAVTETIALDGERRPAGNTVTAADLAIADAGGMTTTTTAITPTASNASSYNDDAFGFNVTWDSDVWEQIEDDAEQYLTIETESTSLYFEGLAYTGTADEAFAELTDPASIEDGTTITEWTVAENADGEPIAGTGDTGSYGVFTYVFTDEESGESEDRVVYIQVQPLVEGESVVAITSITYDRETYNDDIELVFDVIDSLEVTGEEPREEEQPDPEIDDDIWISRPYPAAS